MSSTRMALRLALGILCGVALVLLPAVFSIGTPMESPASNGSVLGQRAQPGTLAPLYGLNGSAPNGLSFLTIIVFILLPSTVFSLLVRRWAERRAKDFL